MLEDKTPGSFNKIISRIGVTLLLFFSLLFIPLLGFFASVFTPVPIVLGTYRHGAAHGSRVAGGAALIGCGLLAFLGLGRMIPYLIEMLLLGILVAEGMRRNWALEKTIGVAGLIVFAAGAVLFLATHGGVSGEMVKAIEENLYRTLSETYHHYQDLFPDQELPDSRLRSLAAVMVRLIPGVALASTLVIAWLNLLTARRFCNRYGWSLPQWGEWSHWKSPDALVFGIIGSGFVLLLPGGGLLETLGLNGLIVFGTIYFFQGLAIVVFYMKRWNVPSFLRGIVYAFVLFQQLATLTVVLAGLFDVWFDFRGLSKTKSES